jgi:radical SAM superfamily enzyme YgiQ (UPF0313 family)
MNVVQGDDMKVKMILPALTEAKSPLFRPIKYSLFPPLGLATLAGLMGDQDEIELQDEHVEPVTLDDEPDMVVIQVYITNASRAYRYADHYRAKGSYVCLGGLHVTALPDEAAAHADSIFLGPGEDTWVQFLADHARGRARERYVAPVKRSIQGIPPIRRDLIKRELYLVPNSLVVSRGCPHRCDFCYKEAFFAGGNSFYTQKVDEALAEIDRLPGKHLYFLDDHLFGDQRFARALFEGMKGMGRVWQSAATIQSVLKPGLLELAEASGLRSLFVGLESLSDANLRDHSKVQNLNRSYDEGIKRLHDCGVMINASFVFGMDDDGPDVFQRTVDWAVGTSIETSTFHVMTPYPGTGLFDRMEKAGRLRHRDWDLYDTRHAVFEPARMTPAELEDGYWKAYREFYRWRNIFAGAGGQNSLPDKLRHLSYAAGWKKFEKVWHLLIRFKQVSRGLPLLERSLDRFLGSNRVC